MNPHSHVNVVPMDPINGMSMTGKSYIYYSDVPEVQYFLLSVEDMAVAAAARSSYNGVLLFERDVRALAIDFIWILSPGRGGIENAAFAVFDFGSNSRTKGIEALTRYSRDLTGSISIDYRSAIKTLLTRLPLLEKKPNPLGGVALTVSFLKSIDPARNLAEAGRKQARQRNREREQFRRLAEKYYDL